MGCMTRLVIAAIQANPTVGAIEKNEALARDLIGRARDAGADLALFSELFLNGYPPEDLALKPAFWISGRIFCSKPSVSPHAPAASIP